MSNVATIEHDAPEVQTGTALTPMEMLNTAVERGASIETLEKLMSLQERWEANQARKAFDNAMAAAKAEIPTINKNRRVGYEHKNGGGETSYQHEDLAEIARVVTPILAKNGLSYRFRTASPVNEPVTVTCVISHRDGHSEENTLVAGADNSGKKNSIQAIGSTITYLQRYTLKAALGLAAAQDDDGGKADLSPITEEHLQELWRLIEEVNVDTEKFCRFLRVEALADLPDARFQEAVDAINARRKA